MDILMLSGELAGGAPQVMHQISKHFPSDISVTVGYLGGRDELSQKFEEIGVPVLRVAEKPYSPTSVWKLHRFLRGRSPDLIHTHMISAGLLGRWLGTLHGIPVIHTVHTNYRMRPFVAKYLDVVSAPLGQCAVCVSNSVEHSLPSHYCSETTVIHNCIDIPEILQEGRSQWEELDWADGLDPDAPIVANVARYDLKKRRRDIVEGFERVVADHPNAQLVLTGRRDGRESRLAKLARKLDIVDNVFFVGFVDSPQTVYHHSDVVVFGSESEGFSIGLLEAMAHERPIVATDIDPFVEALGEDYPGLVPVRSPAEMGEMVAKAIQDTPYRTNLAEISSRRVESFAGDTAATRYGDLYRRYASDGV